MPQPRWEKCLPVTIPSVYIDLRPFSFLGLAVLLFYPPYLRGLFFAPELLVTHMASAMVFLLVLLDRLLRRKRVGLAGAMDYFALGLVGAFALSLTAAVNMREAVGAVLKYANFFLIYWSVSRWIRSYKDMEKLVWVLFLGALGVAVIGLGAATGYIQYPGAVTGDLQPSLQYSKTFALNSTLQYKNAFAAYIATASVLGLVLWFRSKNYLLQSLLGTGNMLMLVALLATQSRGGWVIYPLAVALLLAGVPSAYRWRGLYLFFLNLGLALFTTRLFWPRVLAGNGAGAARALLAGVAVMLAAHLVIWLGERLMERLDPSILTRNLLKGGGVGYLGLVFTYYIIYASGAVTSVSVQFVPWQIATRAQAINMAEPNFAIRLEYYRDAWAIIKNHPFVGAGGGAWNALYHRYQDFLYFTTEVHNQFLQLWVESGTPGLILYLGLWVAALVPVVKGLLRRREKEDWVVPWATTVAALALGVHSFFDFDLSLAALAIVLWSFFGMLRAAGELSPGHKAQVPRSMTRTLLSLLAGIVAALFLFVPSYRLYQAGQAGARGARAMAAQEMALAQAYMETAHRQDPFSASYVGDLAQIYTVLGLEAGDVKLIERARDYAALAKRREPYNPRVRTALSRMYMLQGWVDQSVAEARALLDINPLDITAYEYLGQTYIIAARFFLGSGRVERARPYVELAGQLPAQVSKKAEELKAARHPLRSPPFTLTPVVRLVGAQAAFLAGGWESAGKELQSLAKDPRVSDEARIWLAAMEARQGNQDKARRLLSAASRPDAVTQKDFSDLVAITLIEKND